jgi:RNA polymerase sigma-70 factor (ECF subfamily)
MVRGLSGQDGSLDANATTVDAAPSAPSAMQAAVKASSDQHAFRRIFDEHYAFVWRSVLHLGVSQAAADDAAQEVFLVVHRRLGSYDTSQPLRAWLWGIARHVAANQRRTAMRDARRLTTLAADRSEISDDAERLRELAFVREIVLEMDEPLRDVLVLSDIEGLTAVEIASALEVNVNTIYSRLRIARQRFAEVARKRGHDVGGAHGR